MQTNSKSVYGSEVNGRFTLIVAYFDNGTPYRYFREVPLVADPTVNSNILNAGENIWLITNETFVVDLTLDYVLIMQSINCNFQPNGFGVGIRTDNKLQSAILQPRVQMTWDVKENLKITYAGQEFLHQI
jgi:hypothetical protein